MANEYCYLAVIQWITRKDEVVEDGLSIDHSTLINHPQPPHPIQHGWNLPTYPFLQTSLSLLQFPFFDFAEVQNGDGRWNAP